MWFEKRIKPSTPDDEVSPHRLQQVDLPKDFLKSTQEIFADHFKDQLKVIQKMKPGTQFHAFGWVYQDELVLGISLLQEREMNSITGYASIDFDPMASAPSADDLLKICVDALGTLLEDILPKSEDDRGRLEVIETQSLSQMDAIPFEWSPLEIDRRKVFVRIDRVNPILEALADQLLSQPGKKRNLDS